MLLKLEIYLDVKFDSDIVVGSDVNLAKDIYLDALNSDVKKIMKSKSSELVKQLEISTDSFKLLTKEEIFERMRTTGKT
jgi:hypothetical protein